MKEILITINNNPVLSQNIPFYEVISNIKTHKKALWKVFLWNLGTTDKVTSFSHELVTGTKKHK